MQLEELIIPLTVNDLASKGIGNITSGLGKLNLGFIAVGASIAAMIGLMAGAVKASFEWADELDKLQDVTGVTNKQAAALNFVLRKSGVGTETLTKGMVILEKGLVKVDGTLDTTGQKLEDWGINVKDANGNVKDQATLIDDISKKYNSFSTQQERVNFLTDVFGRNGAELVDFFDTLAQEGGIDAVTQKVEKFGLAIDPSRYEAFNRNLNELKLIGTGLAVQFTEKLMPALEGVLDFFGKFAGMSPEDMFKNFGRLLEWLPAKFQNWAERVDWGKVSQDLINGINSIDWAGLGDKVRIAVGQILSGLGTVVKGIDWKGIFAAIGTAFLNFMAGLTGQSNWDNVKKTWGENLEQLKEIVGKLIQQAKDKVDEKLDAIKDKFSSIWQSIKDKVLRIINDIIAAINSIPLLPDIPGLGNGNNNGRRASGGPVIAGQSYQVAEFNQPEVFIPNANGRVESPNQTQNISVEMDEKKLARAFAQELQTMGIF